MVLKSKLLRHIDYDTLQQQFDEFLLSISPEQYKSHTVDNGMIWVVYDDQSQDRLASLNQNKVSDQPFGDPTIEDDVKNTATWIDNSCNL